MSRRRVWADPDQRRAAALSLLVHAVLLLVLVLWVEVDLPDREPPESFLVIDLGTPALADVESPAAADDAPAADAPSPEVAADVAGRPVPGTPQVDESTGGEAVAEPTTEAEPPAPPRPEQEDVAEPETPEPPVATTPVDVPTPNVRAPEATLPSPSPEVTVAVPEIESPEIAPRPLPEALAIPTPSARPAGGAVALSRSAPDVRAEARDLARPTASVQAPPSRGLTVPEPSASAPQARAVVAPEAVVGAEDGRSLVAPLIRSDAGNARALGVAPDAGVRALRRLPSPAVQAAVRALPPDPGPGAAANVPDENAPAGGDAATSGQPGGPDDAAADALGRAASPDGEEGGGGSFAAPPPPLRETRPRPLAVILDNALGYPQAGLPQASWIAEMPVEGGSTRLMAFFDAGEPARVGPVRSARDYFVEVAARADAVVVHDGGSPSALIALDQGMAPSLNSYRRGDLFERAADRSAPYDLYSAGSALRSAIRTMNIDALRLLTGFRPVPPSDEAPRASGVAIDWSGAYDSGFRYVDAQDRYRWIRNGDDAVSASATAVQVEAVLIARVNARPIPNDSAGRLYIPVSGGEALLLWRGAVMEGRWSVDGGLRFTDEDGNAVSLEALVTWAAFVPQDATVELR